MTGELYKNPHFGFTVRYGQILSQGVAPAVSTANGDLTLSYKDDNGDALGQLQIAGLAPNGQTAEQIVDAEVNQIASGAQLKYVIPGSMIGYQPGFGAAYNFTPDSGNGQTGVDRLIVLAAIHNGLAIVSLADGPLVVFGTGKGQFNTDFASIADSFAALLGDPVLNTVLWPGQTFP